MDAMKVELQQQSAFLALNLKALFISKTDKKSKTSNMSGFFLLFLILIGMAFLCSSLSLASTTKAPDFQAIDLGGDRISLSKYQGTPVLLHITNIENPICRECENALRNQTREISLLKEMHPGIAVITLNIRKSPYSKDGQTLAKNWWGVQVTWPWVEDFDPYPITTKYINYTTSEGGFANPTLILIDRQGMVSGLYHVYQLGKGEIDGIKSAETLYGDLKESGSGNSTAFELKDAVSGQKVNYLGMFVLGIVTSLSPCSVALLLAMFSYVMTARRKEEYLRKSTSASTDGFLIGVAFTFGMAAVFFVVGLFLSDIGVFIREAAFFDLAAGALMILLGANILKPIGEIIEPVRDSLSLGQEHSEAIAGEFEPKKKRIMERLVHFSMGLFQYSALIGAFALGVFFALGWAPCAVSLVFPVLIWLVSQDITPLGGGLMLFVFGVGHGVPVIPIATFSRAVGGMIGERYVSAGKWVTKIFGASVILIGFVYAVRYLGYKVW